MRLRQALHAAALSLILCLSLLLSPIAAKTRPAAALNPGYLPALAAADHFLQAWQSGDVENGMALLTSHAREKVTTEVLEGFFSNSGPPAYQNVRAHRRFSSIVIVDTGHGDWAVDKLP